MVAPTGSRRNPFPTAPVRTRVLPPAAAAASSPSSSPAVFQLQPLVYHDPEESAGASGAPVGAPAFASLGLDTRLVGKLVGARSEDARGALAFLPSAAGGCGGEGGGGASAGVVRGHLRDGFGLARPTRVQRLVIPLALGTRGGCGGGAGGRPPSLLIKSETGSGKTLAFLLPIVQGLLEEHGGGGGGGPLRARGTRALVVAPTRELCAQIFGVASRLTQPFPFIVPGLLSGGEKRKSEKARLRKGCAIVVATPGRLLDHLTSTAAFDCSAATLRWLVLDEADRLLDMGFGPQVEQVVAAMARRGGGSSGGGHAFSTFLLSATLSSGVKALAAGLLGAFGVLVDASAGGAAAASKAAAAGAGGGGGVGRGEGRTVGAAEGEAGGDEGKGEGPAPAPELEPAPPAVVYSAPKLLRQTALVVPLKWRLVTLLAVLQQAILGGGGEGGRRGGGGGAPARRGVKVILFLSTCDGVDFHAALFSAVLPQLLRGGGGGGKRGTAPPLPAANIHRLHGNVPQAARTAIFRAFGAAEAGILIATDVAARGLDLPAVDLIIQADPPSETGDYVHRIGRTARRGAGGAALLLLQPHEEPYLGVLRAAGLSVAVADAAPALSTLAAASPPHVLLGFGGGGGGGALAAPAAPAPPPPPPPRAGLHTLRGVPDADVAAAIAALSAPAPPPPPPRSAPPAPAPPSAPPRVLHLFRIAREMRAVKGLAAADAPSGGGTAMGRVAEAYAVAWQTWLEELTEAGLPPPAAGGGNEGAGGEGAPPPPPPPRTPLLPLARAAFTSFVRAYATHEKSTRHIFHPRSLHLGHAAKAFGLREPPSRASRQAARGEEAGGGSGGGGAGERAEKRGREGAAAAAEQPHAPATARDAKRQRYAAAEARRREEGGARESGGGGNERRGAEGGGAKRALPQKRGGGLDEFEA